ncbi:hypothetical protein [Methylobacterium oxalidis]|uniref:Lipoprotein n=1 Tax=Methylobacterium oxalidis TaxID=944322 RepID=A0A512J5N4_9HYPH|nr:hypothetical protein [Methylobacterium oxalidis]GEP05169.1 hypothetical protein MOX02_32070 [Methylobacterium oxalidis]GJE31819.1 hypothetical protein LDDCCGHA_1999 [Methylobacterium oxalidis]GLS62539.1 hypothetical protein GCM10007888_09200 [Methylobacterium oxalidis]
MRAPLLALPLLLACAAPALADACDTLAARMIRATGASIAGRQGSLAVFRAADADRMSLDCRKPARVVLGSHEREPDRRFFALIGLAAEGLAGASRADAAVLGLRLHQDSLLAGAPQEGVVGRASLRCETGPRGDGLAGNLTVCVLRPREPTILRSRAGLSPAASAG